MPSVLGSGFSKIMGPLMTAGGLIAAPFTGGATLPLALSGATSMMGQGGILGPKTPSAVPPPPAPAITGAAPMTAPESPSTPGAGLSLNTPGGGSAGAGGDYGQQIASNLLSSSNPFAQYATAA